MVPSSTCSTHKSSFAPTAVASVHGVSSLQWKTSCRSTTLLKSSNSDAIVSENLEPRTDDPNVFNFPSSVFPEYQPLPFLVKTMIGFISLLTWSIITPVASIFTSKNPFHSKNLKFLLKSLASFFISATLIQDIFCAPSRIDTTTLAQNNWLPSKLSSYSIVSTSIPPQVVHDGLQRDMDPIGVHFLEYKNEDHEPDHEYQFDAIHFNHGFGASSLSWLPVIPSLTERLGGRVGMAHDAPGFGFTDKPLSSGRTKGLVPYSSAGSAAIGNALLKSKMDIGKKKKVVLFGHSMGCASTLKMALALPSEVEKTIVLVAPALVGEIPNDNSQSKSASVSPALKVKQTVEQVTNSQPSSIRIFFGAGIAALRRVILDPVIMYILRRAVGRPGFWKKGLKLAWGNPSLLSDTDAMRFQWPSIGLGWESGLLSFTRSRIASTCPYHGGEVKLLSDVLNMPLTKVVIIQGIDDPIVPLSMTKKIVDHFEDRISFIPLPGQGHDPFEEEVEEFVDCVVHEIQKS